MNTAPCFAFHSCRPWGMRSRETTESANFRERDICKLNTPYVILPLWYCRNLPRISLMKFWLANSLSCQKMSGLNKFRITCGNTRHFYCGILLFWKKPWSLTNWYGRPLLLFITLPYFICHMFFLYSPVIIYLFRFTNK